MGLGIYGLVVDKIGSACLSRPLLHLLTSLDRYSLMGALSMTVVIVLLPFFAKNFGMVLAGTTINNAVLAFVSAIARKLNAPIYTYVTDILEQLLGVSSSHPWLFDRMHSST